MLRAKNRGGRVEVAIHSCTSNSCESWDAAILMCRSFGEAIDQPQKIVRVY